MRSIDSILGVIMAFSRSRVDLQRLKKIYSYGRVKAANATDVDVPSNGDVEQIQNDCVLIKNTAFSASGIYNLVFDEAFDETPFIIASINRNNTAGGLSSVSISDATKTGVTVQLHRNVNAADNIAVVVFALRPTLSSRVYDMNRYRFVYPSVRVAPTVIDYVSVLRELNDQSRSLDAGVERMNSTNTLTIPFNIEFPVTPIVVTTLETTEGFVTQQVTNTTTTLFTCEFSGVVSGLLHWHAFMELGDY